MEIIPIILFISFDALGDATRDIKKKLSHFFQSLAIISALALAILYTGSGWKDAIILFAWYGINRLFLFDIIYNLTGRLPIDFIGSTSWYDILTEKTLVSLKMPSSFYLFIKFIIWFSFNGWVIFTYKL